MRPVCPEEASDKSIGLERVKHHIKMTASILEVGGNVNCVCHCSVINLEMVSLRGDVVTIENGHSISHAGHGRTLF